MKTLLSSLLLQATMFTVTSVYSAESQVTRTHSFNLADIREVEITGSVGEMEIVLVDGEELRLVLDIEGQDGGWFRSARDVSEVRGDRLILRMEEDDTRTEWSIELPAVAFTRVNLGVGEIRAEIGATDLDVELGVGEADIQAPLASAGAIDLSAGVGEASVSGAHEIDEDRAFVSQNVHARGEGDYPVEVRVGVGEVSVDLD